MKLEILWVKLIILNLYILIIYIDHKYFVRIQTFKKCYECFFELENSKN